MNLPAHVRCRQGACALEVFLRKACRHPCPVLLGRKGLLVLSYGGRWETRVSWN